MPEIDLFDDDAVGVLRDARQVWDCKRCGSIVRDRARHHFWHGAVDTNTTTQLPGGGSDA